MSEVNDPIEQQTEEPRVEHIEDKYALNYAEGYVQDRLDIFNAHEPILAGTNLKLTKPEPINFGRVVVGQTYTRTFNIRFDCTQKVHVTTSAEGITLNPSILEPEALVAGTEVEITYVPTEAQGLYGVLDEYIGFNGELQGIKLDVKAEVLSGKEVPVVRFSSPTCTYSIGDEITPETFPTLTFDENVEITYTSSDPEVAVMNNGVIEVLAAGITTFTATSTETELYAPASDSFVLTVVDPNAQPEPTPTPDPTPDPEPENVLMTAAGNSSFSATAEEIAGSLQVSNITSAEFSLESIEDSAYANSLAVVLHITEEQTPSTYYFPVANESNKLLEVTLDQNNEITALAAGTQSATNAVNNAMRAEYNAAMNIANNTENVTYSNRGWVINVTATQISQFTGSTVSVDHAS